MTLASAVTGQLLFDGAVNGLAIGLIALGVVLVYRSSRVVNFAVGNLGLVGAALLALLTIDYGVPFWLAALVAVVTGTLAGAVVELVVVRRLFDAARVTLLVATIGVAQLAIAVVRALPPIDGALSASYPAAIGGAREIAGVRVAGPQLTIVLVVPLLAAALSWFLQRTVLGRAVVAAADNPRLARTVGINPKLVSTAVWAIAGLLSTVSMVLISGQSGRVLALTDLGPNTMVRALAAAVLAGMTSFRRALAAGVAIGVAQALVRFNYPQQTGLIDLLLFGAVLAAVALRAHRDDPASGAFPGLAARAAVVPAALRSVWWARNLDRLALAGLLAVGVALPLLVTRPSSQLVYSTVLAFALCATSLTVLTGWAGQLSLGQMGFAGLGALLAAALARGLETDLGLGGVSLLRLDLPALTFPTAVAGAAMAMAALAGLIGAAALRVRGLLLAVITFAFGLAAAQYLYRRPALSGGATSSVRFARTDLWGLDLAGQRTYYYVVLAVLVAVLAVVARLRRTGVGRSTIAVRDNPTGAAAFTVSPFRSQVVAFALSGGLAGLGGALLAGAVGNVPLNERFFQVEDSLLLVAIVVIGGLGSTAGPVLGAVWVIGLPAFFPDNDLVPLFASSLGLLVLLLYLPGGLVDVPHRIRAALLAWAERRAAVPIPRNLRGSRPPGAETTQVSGVVLAAHDVVVRFGGNVAVDGASIELRAGEVLGLIGANGAGKSTLLNAIGGFVPATGRIELLGADVTGLSAPGRARRGLGRTFQAAPLFRSLTVRETVLVALEAQGRTGLLGSALFLPPATRAERAKRRRADELIDLLGLGDHADRTVAQLSTGTRRIVELAGLLALDARVLCLDEPTAGIAQRETEALAPLLLRLRRDLGAAMVVIEHDMPFIRSISDRLYCLEAGRVIAEGAPDEVCGDPRVVASYLGTDDRAVARSGTARPSDQGGVQV
ncbi:MAG TPA: ATP-binding cassette domain-containing protein [Acidimicrobiales bacterium]|nr:ATP-binding cassette domain-containing protein [Acidimicrobiales bacterium]